MNPTPQPTDDSFRSEPASPQKVDVYRARTAGVVEADGVVSVDPKAAELEEDLRRVRAFATLMDASFEVAGVKVGLDTLIGLVPVLGDTVSAALALYPLHIARKHKLSRWVRWRMSANVAADWAIGLIPFVGDVVDVAFKANMRNARLLEQAAAKRLGKPLPTPPTDIG